MYWTVPAESDMLITIRSYLGIFLLLVLGTVLTFMGANATLVLGVIRAARKIHAQLMHSILGTTLRWVDSTPSSRVITRCTKDIKAVDGQLAFQFKWLGAFSLYCSEHEAASADTLRSECQCPARRPARRHRARRTRDAITGSCHLSPRRLGWKRVHESAATSQKRHEQQEGACYRSLQRFHSWTGYGGD